MKYKGYYWTILSPIIKGSIAKKYSKELAASSVKKGKQIYRDLLSRADDIGPGNPMELNAYFAYVFVACWLGSGKKITPDSMADIMTDVLHKIRPVFGFVNINSKSGNKLWYKKMKKYEKWSEGKLDKYPTTWIVNFDENRHETGSFYYFTRCPVCMFCQKEGISEIMGPLCSTDSIMFEMQHGTLHRKCTLAKGDSMCDYWIVGDHEKNPK